MSTYQAIRLFGTLLLGAVTAARPLRDIEFRVYSQYPLNDLAFTPLAPPAAPAAIQAARPVPVQSHILRCSRAYRFRGQHLLQFYHAPSGTPVARVGLSQHSNQWLLIFLNNPRHKHNPAQQPAYLIYPFDQSEALRAEQPFVLLNLSGQRLHGWLQQQRIQIDHGASVALAAPQRVTVQLWMRGANRIDQLQALRHTYQCAPKQRSLLILFPPVLSGSAELDARLLSMGPNQSRTRADDSCPTNK
mgnify:CR=1 FL=1